MKTMNHQKPMKDKFLQFIINLAKKNETRLHELNYLFWECTRRCNLHCLHCGSDCSADSATEDIPFEDFLRAILPFKKTDSKITVAITGGEPLLRKDLSQCGMKLRQNGFHWGIVTNGYGYTPEVHEKLLAAGMTSITVSLDGLEASHNWLRANEKSFERTVAALDLIVASNRLVYDVVTCVNQKNLGELEEIKEFLIERHVKEWRLFTISPIGRAALNDDLSLGAEQLKRLMDFIVLAREDNRIKVNFACEAYLGEYEGKVRDYPFFCRAGINVGSILADGSISACPNINRHFIQGNIYTDSFYDVWNTRFKIMRDRSWTKTGICKNCDSYKNCVGGPMHLWNEKKDSIMNCIYQKICSV